MLIKKVSNDVTIWGIWKVEESTEYLLSQLNSENHTLNRASPKRLKEQVGVRVLLKTLIGEEKIISYNQNGKPYLADNSYFISISHTKGYVAVLLSKKEQIGIDIEYVSEKVIRVRDRFVSENEYIDSNNETIHLLLHWSAKETMYKALGNTGVDFKEHLHIDKFIPNNTGVFDSHESFSDEVKHLKIEYQVENDYVLTMTY